MASRLSGAVLTVMIVLSGASIASSQETGVHVDPDSPAGKEYALPLESARRDAAGTDGPVGPADAAPLFGAGISARDRGGPRAGGDRDGAGESPGGGAGPDGAGDDGLGAEAQAVRAGADSAGTLSPAVLTGLIAAGVLGIGLLVAVSFRAVRTGDPRP